MSLLVSLQLGSSWRETTSINANSLLSSEGDP